MSIDYLPAAVRHQLDHMDVVAKKTLGLGAMLESGGSSLIKERAAEQRKSTSNGRAERTEQRIQQDAIQDNSSTTLHSKEALHYLTTPSLCDTYVNTQSKTDNEELSRAQLEFAKEEAEKQVKEWEEDCQHTLAYTERIAHEGRAKFSILILIVLIPVR